VVSFAFDTTHLEAMDDERLLHHAVAGALDDVGAGLRARIVRWSAGITGPSSRRRR
jgi:hypothetical protein